VSGGQDRRGEGDPPASVLIAHLSDLHIGAHIPAVVDTLVADVVGAAPDLTVVTGDSTMRARTRQFVEVRGVLDRLPSPRLEVLGNHDLPLVSVSRLVSPYARYRAYLGSELGPVVQISGLRALGLHSMPRWRWKGGPPLAARLLALHHPPFPHGLTRIVGRGRLVRALVSARVDLVLAGHTHVPSTRVVELTGAGHAHRLVEVVAGTATSRRARGTDRSCQGLAAPFAQR
jgi:predicted phosphodiesterase